MYIGGVKLISSIICFGKQIWVLAINIGPSETRKKVTEPCLLSGCSHLQLIYVPRDSINYEFAILMWRFDRPDKDIFSPAPRFFHHSKYMIFFIGSSWRTVKFHSVYSRGKTYFYSYLCQEANMSAGHHYRSIWDQKKSYRTMATIWVVPPAVELWSQRLNKLWICHAYVKVWQARQGHF